MATKSQPFDKEMSEAEPSAAGEKSIEKEGTKEKAAEPEIKFKGGDATDELKEAVKAIYCKYRNEPTLPKMTERIKMALDDKFSKGWVVFAGKHYTGNCPFIEGTMVEFIVEDTLFTIFQTISPN